MVEALKLTVATLRGAEIPFLVAGSVAIWAHGGPAPRKDIDVMLRPQDAEPALQALSDAGMRPERPPEEWLLKAWHEAVLVDVIFCPAGLEMTEEVFERGEMISIMSVNTPVMSVDDVLVTKLSALSEHALDYTVLLVLTRAVREQVDWPALEARTSHSPFARAFFTLVRELGVAPPAPTLPGETPHPRVRVVTGD